MVDYWTGAREFSDAHLYTEFGKDLVSVDEENDDHISWFIMGCCRIFTFVMCTGKGLNGVKLCTNTTDNILRASGLKAWVVSSRYCQKGAKHSHFEEWNLAGYLTNSITQHK